MLFRSFFSKAGIVDRSENTIFYAAPVMSAIGSYISFMALGMVPVYTAGRPSTEIIQSLIEKNNVKISTGRPSLIERFASQGITNLGSVDILVSSGSFITEENTEYITKNLGISRIVDTYNAAETGIMGIMDFLNDDSFTLIDDAEVVSVSDVDFEIKTASTSAIVVDKKIVKTETKTINDIVELDGRNLKLLGRSEDKIKVSGFSVSSEIVKEAFKQIPGIIDCRVKTGVKSKSSDSVIVEYLGQKYEEESLKNLMKEKLPSYSVPQSFVHKTFDNWGVLK